MVSTVVIILSLVFCLNVLLPVKAQVLTIPADLNCGRNLQLTCSISEAFDSLRSRSWVGPSGNTLVNDGTSSNISKYEEDISNAATTNSFLLTIKNVAIADAGDYTCTYRVTTSSSKTLHYHCASGNLSVSRKDDDRIEITIDQVYPSTSTITVSNGKTIGGTTSNVASTIDTSLYKFTWVSTAALSGDTYTFSVVINTGTTQITKTVTFATKSDEDGGLSIPEIVGIVVAVVAVVCIIIITIIVLLKKKMLSFAGATENRDDGGTGGTGSSGDTGGAVAMSLKDKGKLPPIKEKKTASVRPQPTVVGVEDERSLPVPPSGPKTRGLSANFEEFPNMPSKKLAPIEGEMIIEEEEDKKKKKKKKKSRKSDDDE